MADIDNPETQMLMVWPDGDYNAEAVVTVKRDGIEIGDFSSIGMIPWDWLDNARVTLFETSEESHMSLSDAENLVGLWQAGKMIGGDAVSAAIALLREVNKLRGDSQSDPFTGYVAGGEEKHKRFLVFCWNQHYPAGGSDDFDKSFSSIGDAHVHGLNSDYDFYEIFDCVNRRWTGNMSC